MSIFKRAAKAEPYDWETARRWCVDLLDGAFRASQSDGCTPDRRTPREQLLQRKRLKSSAWALRHVVAIVTEIYFGGDYVFTDRRAVFRDLREAIARSQSEDEAYPVVLKISERD